MTIEVYHTLTPVEIQTILSEVPNPNRVTVLPHSDGTTYLVTTTVEEDADTILDVLHRLGYDAEM